MDQRLENTNPEERVQQLQQDIENLQDNLVELISELQSRTKKIFTYKNLLNKKTILILLILILLSGLENILSKNQCCCE
ncbi:hypothetical protein CHISP_0774 [Chitinispirillum alkaliphilum]|nr:hypothetical protein CHISP_0774 [Chitinispirillum alkaliphilum]